jgi:sporulation related protein
MKRLFLVGLMIISFGSAGFTQNKQETKAEICINQEELRLFNLINTYRKENNKAPIPLSGALTEVAKTHLLDLEKNHPDTSVCNSHSWSDKGNWTPCCYNVYLPKPECIQNKPKELTDYIYPGFELILFDSEQSTADSSFMLWTVVEASIDFLLQNNIWAKKRWNAMGVGISEHYSSVWFGEKIDKSKTPILCGSEKTLTEKELQNKEIVKARDNFVLTESNRYHLVFGSFHVEEDAILTVKKFKNSFPEAGLIVGNGKFRISLTNYASLQEAKAARDKLGEKYKSSWILKY